MRHKKKRSWGREVQEEETASSIPCLILLSISKITYVGEADNKNRKALYEGK